MWNPKQYRENREAFLPAELAKYCGQWVAFSPDGRRILASNEDLSALDDLLVANGHDPEQAAFERIEMDGIFLGAAEFR